jgi:YYY domain-containing protein
MLAATTMAGVLVLYLPFYSNMSSPVLGIFPWRGPETNPLHYLLIFGLFCFICTSFLVLRIADGRITWIRNRVIGAILLVLFPLIIWCICELAIDTFTSGIGDNLSSVWQKSWHLLPLLSVMVLTLLSILKGVECPEMGQRSNLFTLLLLFTGLLLTMGCELFYIRDVFNTRMNTVFRFYYQIWVMLAIASTFGLYYVNYRWRVRALPRRIAKIRWRVFVVLLMLGCFILPVGAIYDRMSNAATPPTVDGLAFLQQDDPLEWEAINWLNKNVKGSPVIVEDTGKEYSQYGRVSVYTGLPTILGWAGHESVWRGPGQSLDRREEHIETIYQDSDVERVQSLLDEYEVIYVYVGRLEKSKYGTKALQKFDTFMHRAFQNEWVTIYQVR